MGSATENRFVNLYINGKQAGNSLADITRRYKQLSSEIHRGKLSQDDYNKKVKELQQYGKVLSDHRAKVRGVSGAWSKLKTIALGVLGGNLMLTAFQKVTQFIPNMIKRNAELSDSFADVRKTTGLTEVGMKDLYSSLKAINTRSSRKELLELARDAGKLGIEGVKNIAGFVKSADMINVALGEDLGDDAVTNLGKLNNLFGTSEIYGFEKGLQKLGSVINELGASSEASEGAIVDFTSRLAGVATQANISFENIAGIGSTLDSLGQRTETSSTAITQAIVGMFKDTDTYAKIAGKSTEDFGKILENDANEAFVLFLEGLNGNNEGLTEMSKRFDTLGIDGSRAITVLGALAGNTGKLREQQNLANKSFEEGISLTQEFAIKNNNVAGNLEKIGKALAGMWVNSSLVAGIGKAVSWFEKLVRLPVDRELQKQRVEANALVSSIIKLNTGSQERIDKINQLKKDYPGLTGHIDAETTSNKDLLTVMRAINAEYVKKILLAHAEEDLGDLGNDMSEALLDENAALDEANKQRMKLLQGANDESQILFLQHEEQIIDYYRKVRKATTSAAGQSVKMQSQLQKKGITGISMYDLAMYNQNLQEYEALLEKREAIEREFNDKLENINKISNRMKSGTGSLGAKVAEDEPGGGEEDNLTEAEEKKYNELLELVKQEEARIRMAKLEGEAKELAQIDEHYAALFERAEGHTEALKELEALRQEEIEAVKQKYLEEYRAAEDEYDAERAEARRDIELALTEDSMAAEIASVEAKYDTLIELAKRYNLDTIELEKAKISAVEELNRKSAAATTAESRNAVNDQIQMYGQGTTAIVDMFSAIAGEQSKNAKFQADLAMFQQLINAGVALSSAAASAKGITPVDYLAALGLVIGAVMVRINQAKKMREEAGEVPQYARGGQNIGGAFIAGDQGREIVQGATVIPADITQQIRATNNFRAPMPQPNFAAINDGLTYTQGRQSQSSSVGNGGAEQGNAGMEALMREMIAEFRRSQDKKVVFVDKDFERFRTRKDSVSRRVEFRK